MSKIVSCDCMYKENIDLHRCNKDGVEILTVCADDMSVSQRTDVNFCPICGKKIEVEND